MEFTPPFGQWLKTQRARLDLTQGDLARRVGYSPETIRKIEAGALKPSKQIVDLLADHLGVPSAQRDAFLAFATDARVNVNAAPIALGNLPVQLTRFIGREGDLAEVQRLLGTTRLLTLTGSGGCGKTRLAQEAAARATRPADGVWLVELASISDATLVADTALRVFDLPPTNRQPIIALTDYVRDKRLLLILDNCEHLIAACAALAEALLRACPKLRILATSREALNIPGETTWRVPEMPDADAVQLFTERARSVRPDFELTAHTTTVVGRVCERLDRMPLAIELAAARLGAMKLEEVAARLDDRFRLLTGGSRTALPRQQTLRATIEWSYDLLTEQERTMLQRLSVFAGGMSAEAAEAVCADDTRVRQADVLNVLLQLCAKSLVIAEESGERTRYRLLETVRQYAAERLAGTGAEESEAARARHLAFFTDLIRGLGASSPLISRRRWLDEIETEYDNIRAATGWVTDQEDLQAALNILDGLQAFWTDRGYMREGLDWIEKTILPASGDVPTARVVALSAMSWIALRTGRLIQAREWMQQVNTLARHLEDEGLILDSIGLLGQVLPKHEDAIAAYQEAIQIASQPEHERYLSFMLMGLGCRALMHGHIDQAAQWLEQSLTADRKFGDEGSWTLKLLGLVECERGHYEQAMALFKRSLANARDDGDKIGSADVLIEIATVALLQGDVPYARTSLREALETYHWVGNDERVAQCLAVAAGLAHVQGQLERAVRLLASTADIRYGPRPTEDFHIGFYRDFDRRLASLTAAMDEPAFKRAWAEGQVMTLDQAVEEALGL